MTKKQFEELVNKENLTEEEKTILEPYRAKRAIFLAAGLGSRLRPITINTPKPMVRVHGVRIIDTLIDACLKAGIEEIYLVRGYLAEEFNNLLYKYPMIHFIDNTSFDKTNNISSAMLCRDFLQNAYVLEADLLVSNPDIIRKYHYRSEVLGIWKEETNDWCLETDENNIVIDEKMSGKNCYQMVGIYYWNAEDGKKLASHIAQVYETEEGRQRYWETVPNQVFKGEYQIEVIPCEDKDIVEIDTFEELKAIDAYYS